MDRLSDAARAALGAYRGTLALEGRRVDRNWSTIERRAADDPEVAASDDLDDLDGPDASQDDARVVAVPRARNTVAIVAAAVAVAAAIVAVVAVAPGLAAEAHAPVDGAAAYEAIGPERIESSTARAHPPAATSVDATSVDATAVDATAVDPTSVDATSVAAPSIATGTRPAKRGGAAPRPAAAATPRVDRDPSAELVAQTALLRRARAALRDGDPHSALAAADEYARRFAGGTLAEEIAFVRLTALCEAGRVDEGRAAARNFVERYPGSPLSGRAAKRCAEPR